MSDNEDAYDDEDGEEEYDEGEELDAELDAEEEEGLEKEDADIDEFGEETQEEEQEPEPDENPLNRDHLYGGQLSLLENIGPGLACAYIRLDVPKKELTDIVMLENFIHLRYLDVSENFLTDISPVSVMTNLCSLEANKNRLATLHLDELPYLQKADFAHNKLVSMEGTSHPLLEELILEANKIQRISFPNIQIMSNLRILNLRSNKISTLAYEFPPNLEELYLSANMITTLEGITVMPKLKKLHLRENQIEKINGIEQEHVPTLTYLNLRGNNIVEARDLKKLRSLETLTDIIIQENPIQDDDDYREAVIAAVGARKTLRRLDKDRLDAEDIELALEKMETMDKEDQEAEANTIEMAEGALPEDMALTGEKSTESELQFTMNASVGS